MQASELLKIIVGVVSLVAAALGGLVFGAFMRHRTEILRVEKLRALRKFYPSAHEDQCEPDQQGVKPKGDLVGV